MKGFIFFLVSLFSISAYSNYNCDNVLERKILKHFDRLKPTKLVRCLHIQPMEKIITIVEIPKGDGALSLFVFEEENLSILSEPIASIEDFAVDGMKDIISTGLGLAVKNGIGFYFRESSNDGVIVLQFKNENEYNDVSLLVLQEDGQLKNINIHPEEVDNMEIAQTENMDLYVFKVKNGDTFDFIPWSQKVSIGSSEKGSEKQEIFFDRKGRMPAGFGVPKN